MKTVYLEYFASIAEKTKTTSEEYTTYSKTIEELWLETKIRHQLEMDQHNLRASKNHRFCDWDQNVDSGDIISFIPPVSGG